MHGCTVAFGSGWEGGTCWGDQCFLTNGYSMIECVAFSGGNGGRRVREWSTQAKMTQIARWRVVIAIFGNECSTGRQLADLEEEAAQDVLSNIFADKAAKTRSTDGRLRGPCSSDGT